MSPCLWCWQVHIVGRWVAPSGHADDPRAGRRELRTYNGASMSLAVPANPPQPSLARPPGAGVVCVVDRRGRGVAAGASAGHGALICSGSGAIKVLVKTDDGAKELSATLDCPLCARVGSPPASQARLPVVHPGACPAPHPPAAHIAARTAAPLPPRGPLS